MSNFWDFEVWSWILLFGVLLGSLLVANVIKKAVPFLRESLIPTSVLGGILLLIISSIYTAVTGELLFDSAPFAGKGMTTLEIITTHSRSALSPRRSRPRAASSRRRGQRKRSTRALPPSQPIYSKPPWGWA